MINFKVTYFLNKNYEKNRRIILKIDVAQIATSIFSIILI